MTTAYIELYEVLKGLGVDAEIARKATTDIRSTNVLEAKIDVVDTKVDGVDRRVTLLTWFVGLHFALTLLTIGFLFQFSNATTASLARLEQAAQTAPK